MFFVSIFFKANFFTILRNLIYIFREVLCGRRINFQHESVDLMRKLICLT